MNPYTLSFHIHSHCNMSFIQEQYSPSSQIKDRCISDMFSITIFCPPLYPELMNSYHSVNSTLRCTMSSGRHVTLGRMTWSSGRLQCTHIMWAERVRGTSECHCTCSHMITHSEFAGCQRQQRLPAADGHYPCPWAGWLPELIAAARMQQRHKN